MKFSTLQTIAHSYFNVERQESLQHIADSHFNVEINKPDSLQHIADSHFNAEVEIRNVLQALVCSPRVSAEVTFGRGGLSICSLGCLTGAHECLVSNPPGVSTGTNSKVSKAPQGNERGGMVLRTRKNPGFVLRRLSPYAIASLGVAYKGTSPAYTSVLH